MSWQPYVDTLTSAGFCKVCITGHNGQTWGATPSFKVPPVEVQRLIPALQHDKTALASVQSKGFTIQSIPYALTRLDTTDDEIRYLIGRCKQFSAPSCGIVVARTAQTCIIAIHDPVYAQTASFEKGSVAVYQLAESLSAMNF